MYDLFSIIYVNFFFSFFSFSVAYTVGYMFCQFGSNKKVPKNEKSIYLFV